jgi:predicted protein tyrosine phosphatase
MQRKGAHIHVCGLRRMPERILEIKAAHLISVIEMYQTPETPASIHPTRHLKLQMDDITEAQSGMTLPSMDHVTELLAFVDSWDRQSPMLIHCFAGMSRSTAAAFIALCVLHPEASEERIAQALRKASDTAVPNRLLVRLGDLALGRNGKMINAVRNMSPYMMDVACTPFFIDPVSFSDEPFFRSET